MATAALRKLIIFDLNGTLIARERKSKAPRSADFKHAEQWIWFRPHLRGFLDFCLANFDVAVWSSAMHRNTQPIVERVFEDARVKQLLFHFHREACSPDGSPGADPWATLKDLHVVWKAFPQHSESTTFLVDDSTSKLRLTPRNHILLPEFTVRLTSECFHTDPTLTCLEQYLRDVILPAEDIRDAIEQCKFAPPPLELTSTSDSAPSTPSTPQSQQTAGSVSPSPRSNKPLRKPQTAQPAGSAEASKDGSQDDSAAADPHTAASDGDDSATVSPVASMLNRLRID
eukprot:TRINITY_DN14583_c0_g1_i1.p1 TRINITY_DN14583_c0_g1~~TRINITY_DN14583_c0_g1_i1.p1  ORF type:complete len:303 (+),score=50.43 TRINITY_DN14583_c0_g1_i1:54-911(+)